MRFIAAGRSRRNLVASGVVFVGDQHADFDAVVSEHSEPAPDAGAIHAVDVGAVPTEAVLEVTDPSLGPGAPLHQFHEAASVLDLLAGRAGLASAGDDHLF